MKVSLIYPHQLFQSHPALSGAEACYIIEDPLFFGTDSQWGLKLHVQKLVLHRASMQSFAHELESQGNTVHLLRTDGAKSSREMLDRLPSEVLEIQLCDVADHTLQLRIEAFCAEKNIKLTEIASPNFVTPKAWSDHFFSKGKKPFMAKFYEAQRRRMDILMEPDGTPTGGQWSFDEANRKKLPRGLELPPEIKGNNSAIVEEARQSIKADKFDTWGSADEFVYPIDHTSAKLWFDNFLKERFSSFGTYEDALSTRDPFLYHSVLTPMLNIGLLNPHDIVQQALKYGRDHKIELNNIEGFVRQIIGWREFMKIMYQKHGSYLRTKNFFGFEAELPASVYAGRTGILPVDITLQRLEKHGYSHHIERLMVMGNFFVLLRVKPDAVYKWFMEMYVDAYDWVMVPNVYGMSQFSDGGLLVTKPYVSGSNYIRKMSDYKAGPWCDAWDSLFWTFVDDHREFFASQYRMKMMLSHLNKMSGEKLEQHHKRAMDVRETLAAGKVWGEDTLL